MLAALGFIVGEQLEDFPAFVNFDGHITGEHWQQSMTRTSTTVHPAAPSASYAGAADACQRCSPRYLAPLPLTLHGVPVPLPSLLMQAPPSTSSSRCARASGSPC
jgi:hypothetical protein